MFVVFPKLRRRVRTKIMNTTNKHKEKKDYLHLKSEWIKHNNGIAPIPGTTTEYDLVFGIGTTCHVTTLLKSFGLRRFSSPFDYTGGIYPNSYLQSPNIYRDSRFR